MNRFARLLVVGVALAAPSVAMTYANVAHAEEAQADPKAVEKIKQFLEICVNTPDINEAGKKVVAAKLVQLSKIDKNDSSQLNPDSLRFAFKKAKDNAKFYQVKITRVQETATSAVGFGPTAQKGKLYKYFVAKKDGVNGMPAPVQVFFPEGGAEPVLYDFGSF